MQRKTHTAFASLVFLPRQFLQPLSEHERGFLFRSDCRAATRKGDWPGLLFVRIWRALQGESSMVIWDGRGCVSDILRLLVIGGALLLIANVLSAL